VQYRGPIRTPLRSVDLAVAGDKSIRETTEIADKKTDQACLETVDGVGP
jgi:hypothetical protein